MYLQYFNHSDTTLTLDTSIKMLFQKFHKDFRQIELQALCHRSKKNLLFISMEIYKKKIYPSNQLLLHVVAQIMIYKISRKIQFLAESVGFIFYLQYSSKQTKVRKSHFFKKNSCFRKYFTNIQLKGESYFLNQNNFITNFQ